MSDIERFPFTNGKPWIALQRINTLDCQQNEMGDDGGQR